MSSFSINLGSAEARGCGLIGENETVHTVIKLIDKENQQIIIKSKKCTLTRELIHQVIEQATALQQMNDLMMKDVPNVGGLVNLCNVPRPGKNTNNEYANHLYNMQRDLEKFLLDLPVETITDLLTLMYMGGSYDADMKLSPTDRFIDYWSYLADSGSFSDGADHMVALMLEKYPLPDYLKHGEKIALQPLRGVDRGEYVDIDE